MINQPDPVPEHFQQVASTSFEGVGEVDFDPEPELFDVDEVSADIWDAIHPA
jgi:hypothetical protein